MKSYHENIRGVGFVYAIAAFLLALLFLVALSGCRLRIPGVDTQNPTYHYTTAPKTNALAPINLLPAVSTRAVVSHAPPAPVTNLVVTWEVNLSNTPSCGWTGSGGWKTNAQGVGYFSTNGLQWTTQYLAAAYLLTWIEERNGGSWHQRTPAYTPQPTNGAVIANTNKSGLLRAAWGWK